MIKISALTIALCLLLPAFTHANELEQALNDYEYGHFAAAMKTLEKLAREDNPEAQYHLAFMYFNGDGVENNDEIAAKWFEQAAMAGHAGAQDILAYMYLNGRGVAADPLQAYVWYSLAAENGVFLANKIITMLEQEMTLEDRVAAEMMLEESRAIVK